MMNARFSNRIRCLAALGFLGFSAGLLPCAVHAQPPTLVNVAGTDNKGFGNHTPNASDIAATTASTTNSCFCAYQAFCPPCEILKGCANGGNGVPIGGGLSVCATRACGSGENLQDVMIRALPPQFTAPTPRPRFSPWPSGGNPHSKGSTIDNGSMSFVHDAMDIACSAPDGVALQRLHRPRDMAILSNFGPMVFSNYDQTLTLTKAGSGSSQTISIESFDPQDLQRKTYSRPSSATGGDFSKGAALERDALKQLTLLQSNLSPISSGNTTDFHGAAYAKAEAWDGSYVLYQLFDIGVSGGRTGRPVKFSSAVGDTNITYKTFSPGDLAASPTRALQIDTVTDRYGSTLSFSYQSTQVSGMWVVSSVTGPGSTTRSYTYGSGTGAKLASVSYPSGPDSTFSYTTDSTAQAIAAEIVDRAAVMGDQKKTAYLSNIAYGYLGGYVYNSVPPNALRMVTNGGTEVTYLSLRNTASDQLHYEGAGRMKSLQTGPQGAYKAEEMVASAYCKDGWNLQSNSPDPSMGGGPMTFSGTRDVLNKQDPRQIAGYGNNEPGLNTQQSDGTTKNYIFDSDNWVMRIDYADGTIEAFCYNAGKKITRYRNRNGEVTKYVYDSANRLTEEHVGLKDHSTNTVSFDPYTLAPLYNRCATNDVQTSEYAVKKWEYVTSGNGAGNVSATIDERNNRTDYEYNAQHRLWKVKQPADTTGGTRPTTVYTYTTSGKLSTVTDPESRVITYVYDALDRLSETQYGDGTSERIEYGTTGNGAGMVVKTIDRLDVVTTYAYDSSQRLTTKVTAAAVRNSMGSDVATPTGMASTTTMTYVHGSDLVLQQVVDGAVTDYKYDYEGRVKEVKTYPRVGVTLTASMEYNGKQLYSTTDPYGRKTYHAYDATDGRLVRTVRGMVPEWTPPSPTGGQTLSQALLAITRDTSANAKFVVSDVVYDAPGRTWKVFNGLATETRNTYDTRGRTTLVQAAYGTSIEAKTETLYDAASNVTEIRSPRYFDTSDTNGNNKARQQWTYTNRNLAASHTDAPGTSESATESFTYDLSGHRATHTDYGSNVWTTNEIGCCALTRISIDPLGHGSITNANSRGQVTHSITVSDVTTHSSNYNSPIDGKTLTESTTRVDVRGRPIYQTAWLSARGSVDPKNPPIAGVDGVSLSDGLTTQYIYDDNLSDNIGLDNSTGVSVPKLGTGGSSTVNVTLANALTKLADTVGNGGASISFSSSAPGRAIVSINAEDEISFTISDASGRAVMSGKLNNYRGSGATAFNTLASWSCNLHDATTTMSGYGTVLVSQSVDALGNSTKSWTDSAGRTLRTIDQASSAAIMTYDAASNQLSVRDPNSVGADMLYDALSRNTQRTDTYSDVTKTEYDRSGNVVKQTDAKNKNTSIAFDARNRRKSTTDRISGVTSFTYTALGQLASLTDAASQTTSYTYDARGSKLTEQYPDHTGGASVGTSNYGIVTFVYDNAGRAKRKQDQLGDTCTYSYDLAGRMTSRDYRTAANSPSGTIADTDSFTFDRAGRPLTAVSGRYTNTVTYTYDLSGRKASESLAISGQTYTIGTEYNARNELVKYTYPDSSISERTYHATGALNQLKLDSSTISTRSYDSGRRMTSEALGNGITESRTYRTDNLVSTITSSNTSLGDLSYTWDANKNKTSETISGTMSGYGFTSGGTSYDFEDRLTGYARAATSGSAVLSQSWSLTSVGDWSSTTINGTAQSRTHGPTHELLTAGGSSVTTDVKGNMTVIPATLREAGASTAMNLVWDFDNRLKSADTDANSTADVTYEYDALGRRVARTDGSSATVFVQADQQTLADYPKSGSASSATYRYVYGSYIDEPVVRKTSGSGGTILYYHRNQQYSIYALSNSSGTVTERYAYTAYGQPTFLNASATVQSSSAANNRYTYTAREWDQSSGLQHFRARWMSGIGGRFLGRDPIGFAGSAWNLYEMLATAPLMRVDPRGYQSTPARDTPSETIPDMLRQPIPCPVEIERLATNSCTNYGGVKAGFPKCYKAPDPQVPGAYLKTYDIFCKDLDCEFSKFQWIRDRKEAYCKVDGVSTSCADIDCPCDRKTCGKIWNNIRDNRGCWKAREDEANLCFKGREDAGHKQAREDAEKALKTCQDKKKECKCSYVFTP